MRQRLILLLAAMLAAGGALARPLLSVTKYGEDDGLPGWHVTQIAQDHRGMIWMATWNGLCRFDGYEFRTFKSAVGDGCDMPTDRIRNISVGGDGNIYCMVDESKFVFDIKRHRFAGTHKPFYNRNNAYSIIGKPHYEHTDSHGTRWRISSGGGVEWLDTATRRWHDYPANPAIGVVRFCFPDRQGNLWLLGNHGVIKLCFMVEPAQMLDMQKPAQVRCLFRDAKGRVWVTTKEDATVRVFAPDGSAMGYLAPDGTLQKGYVGFGRSVYCMAQTPDGLLWMGCKPQGLLRVRERKDGSFALQGIEGLSSGSIYDIKADSRRRLWVATLGGGVNCLTDPAAERPEVATPQHGLDGYPHGVCRKVRYLHITRQQTLLAATTEGLLVADIGQGRALGSILFKRHAREAGRQSSLSCSAVMDIAEDSRGRLFVSTESGGVNMITSEPVTADTLAFRHFNTATGMPCDVTLSATPLGGRLLVVGSNQIMILNPDNGRCEAFGTGFFHRECRFSDAHPVVMADGSRMFGLQDGAFAIKPEKFAKSSYVPPIAITDITLQNTVGVSAADALDTLVVHPAERNVTARFAALDYSGTNRICYAFRLLAEDCGAESEGWNNIGRNNSVTLLDMNPGTYCLEIRSTNADGVWTDNTRRLTIIVEPMFGETLAARLLLLAAVLAAAGAVGYTILYIRRIKRRQRETLAAYLDLLNRPAAAAPGNGGSAGPEQAPKKVSAEDDRMMKAITLFVEQHIADSDINIGDMAVAAATSRSGLQRKMKQMLGVTPLDFLREARIKRACTLLRGGGMTVSEVAFACGFSDPKYFSRCFKASLGKSPTEYRGA